MTLVWPESREATDLDDSHCERRRGFRLRQARPVRIYEGGNGRYFGGETEEICSSGLRIMLPASAMLRPGRMISLHLGASAQGRQMLPARVVWVDRGQSLDFLIAGVEFLSTAAMQLNAA
jgi:hypothetical protein